MGFGTALAIVGGVFVVVIVGMFGACITTHWLDERKQQRQREERIERERLRKLAQECEPRQSESCPNKKLSPEEWKKLRAETAEALKDYDCSDSY